MKKVLSVILVWVLCISSIFVFYNEENVSAYTSHTADEAVVYLHTLVGKTVGSGQCVALVVDYYQYLGAPRPYGNGKDYVTNALPSGWIRIKGAQPQKGDIMIWTGTTYGHVAICGGEGVYFHQNWDGLYVSIKDKSYTNGYNIIATGEHADYWGVIRPDFQQDSHTTHTYSTYAYYEAAHPHYKCYKCSCGDVKANYSETTYVDSCEKCNPAAAIDTGVYCIKNNARQEYMNVEYGTDANAQNIRVGSFGDWASMKYEITPSTTTAGYAMRPLSSSSRVVNVYAETVVSGKNVCIYDNTGHNSQRWQFQKADGGYIIRNVQASNCVLDVEGNGNVYVSTYTGAASQIWSIQNTISYDANGGSNAPARQFKDYGTTIYLSTQTPIRDGYVFGGWAESATAQQGQYMAGADYRQNKNVTLYAVWKKGTCNHRYDRQPDSNMVVVCSLCGTPEYVGNIGWIKIQSKWYYHQDGAMMTDKWVKDNRYWCYVGSDGVMVTNKWIKDGGKWYYLEADGHMAANAWKKDSVGWCYVGSDGAMLTNAWCKDSKGWCYVGADGYAVTNCWKKDSHGWIWLDKNGSMTKNAWVKDGGKWYFLDGNGYMVTNAWKKDSVGWVYLGSDGAMLTNKWVMDSKGWCYVGADGYAVTNCWKKDSHGWIWLDENGSMTKNDWVKDAGKWYYLDGEGYMVYSTSLTIDGEKYNFNSSGVCTNP